MAATVELSTPPDMATAMVVEGIWQLTIGSWQKQKGRDFGGLPHNSFHRL
jgi:hypothetical protein